MNTAAWASENLIFRTIVGSKLFGIAREDSDTDCRGVCLIPPEVILGIANFEQYENVNSGHDEVIYSAAKFIKLCLAANPSVLDILFAPRDKWEYHTYLWIQIWKNRHIFLSQKVRHTFSGYAMSQLKRIKRHKRWIDNPPTKPELIDYGLYLRSTPSGGQKVESINSSVEGFVNPTMLSNYNNRLSEYKKYQEWVSGRNEYRAKLEAKYGYDVKHAGHLVRLMLQGQNILCNGDYNPVLGGNTRETVLAVMHGEWQYGALIAWAEGQDNVIHNMNTPLPKSPNMKKVNDVIREVTARSLCLDGELCRKLAFYCTWQDKNYGAEDHNES